jgi:hypothetical protein
VPPPAHRAAQGVRAAGGARQDQQGWCFGFKLRLVFNQLNQMVAVKLTAGHLSDSAPVPALVKGLTAKLFGDQGYLGQKLADTLLRQDLALITRLCKNMKSLPMTMADKMLLNAKNMAETIIGHLKASRPSTSPGTAPPSTLSYTSSPHSLSISSTPSNPK